MTLSEATAAVIFLTGFFFFLSGTELFLLSHRASFVNVWSDRNLRRDFHEGLPLPRFLTDLLFSRRSFRFLALTEALAAVGLIVWPGFGWLVVLFVLHLMICIRFRGTFNGGSDMMAFVVLTGLLIAQAIGDENGRKLGLAYIALHAGYSYLKAGIVKLAQRDWRSGEALPVFLKRSLLSTAVRAGFFLEKRRKLSRFLGWLTMFFEASVVGLLFFPEGRWPYMVLALGFHFGNFVLFGLNRFFWIWLAAWPALLYALSILR
ncbi:MAG TPA: hypothetical protein PL182_01860 [Pseudobdellovibrionaceae bacterium]|nr:hypothetical protein [Pseudobdellovibrionaceae bacterium]